MSQNSTPSGSNNHTDPEIDHSDVTSQMNVAFVEQQPLVTDDARLGRSLRALPPIMEDQMADEHWMAAQQLSKPVVIRQFNWSLDSAPGALLNQFSFPSVIGENDSIHQETLRMYSFYKFNWSLRFQINGTRFHSGQLIASWDPFIQASDLATYVARPFNVVYATGLPNVLINASSNEPVEITIPFVHPRNFLTTNSTKGFDVLGSLRVNVLNPLRAADGSSNTLSVTVWLYADSPSVHVPIYRHVLAVPTVERAFRSSGLLDVVKGAGSTFGNLVSGNFGGAVKSGGKTLTGLAEALDLDYPSRPVIEQSHINSLGPMSPGKGVDMSYRLGTDPRGGHVPLPAQTGCTIDECDLNVIKKVPMLFNQTLWTDASAVGSVLTYFPVTPNIVTQGGIAPVLYNANTYLSWFSNAFCFWKGSLSYKFEWVSTQFHTGRVLIAFIPNSFNATPTLQEAFSCPNAVVDIQQNSVCTLSVPFVSPTVWKRCDITNTTSNDENVVGYIYVYVLNSLVRPSNVSDTIEYNIYISGGDDFEFSVPRGNPLLVVPTLPAVETALRSIGPDRMAARSDGMSSESDISIAFGKSFVPRLDLFGEEFTLVDYMKRYGLISSSEVASASAVQFCRNLPTTYRDQVADIGPVPDPPDGSTQLTPLTTVTSVFACWFGSLRYKITTDSARTTNSSMTVTYNPLDPAVYPGSFSGGGNPIQRTNLAQNNSLDVELPCYTPFNLLLLRQPTQLAANSPYSECGKAVIFLRGTGDGVQIALDTYQAAGDDFRPFYLISPPADFNNDGSAHYAGPLRT